MFAVNLAFAVGMGLYSFVMPAYARQLGATPAQYGLLISGAFAVGTLAVIPGGPWADRLDRRTLLLIGWAMCLPVPLMFALAPTWVWLIPGYLLFFLSFFCNPSISAYVASIADPGRSGSVWGAINAGFPLGFIIGPPIGAAIIRVYGMQVVFCCTFVCYVVSTLFVWMLSPQPAAAGATRTGASSAHGPSAPGETRHNSPGQRERGQSEQTKAGVPLRTGRWPAGGALLQVGLLFAAFNLLVGIGGNFTSLYLQDTTGLDLGGVGFFGSAGAIGGFLCAPLIGRLRDKVGSRRALPAALGLVVMSNAGLLLVRAQAALFGALVLRGGENGVFTLGQAEMAARAGSEGLGKVFAMFHVLTGIAGAIGPYLGGYLYGADRRLPFLAVIAGSLVLMIVSQPLLRSSGGRRPAGEQRPGGGSDVAVK